METIKNADLVQSSASSAEVGVNYESQLKEVWNLDASAKERIDLSNLVKKWQEHVKVPKHLILKWLNIKTQKSLFQNQKHEESLMDISSVDQSIISEVSQVLAEQLDSKDNESYVAESPAPLSKFTNKNKQIEIISAEEIIASSWVSRQGSERLNADLSSKEPKLTSVSSNIINPKTLNILYAYKNSTNGK